MRPLALVVGALLLTGCGASSVTLRPGAPASPTPSADGACGETSSTHLDPSEFASAPPYQGELDTLAEPLMAAGTAEFPDDFTEVEIDNSANCVTLTMKAGSTRTRELLARAPEPVGGAVVVVRYGRYSYQELHDAQLKLWGPEFPYVTSSSAENDGSGLEVGVEGVDPASTKAALTAAAGVEVFPVERAAGVPA